MPTVQRENAGLLRDRITVTVGRDDYMPAFENARKQYARQANIPGFRKGMVPVGMIRRMYGSALFADEVVRTVEKSLTDYIRTEKMEIFAQPLPAPDNDPGKIDPADPRDYSFSFEVGLKPDFEVADPAEANAPLYKAEVTDEMVDGEVERMRRKLGKMTEPETVSQEENVLNVTFQACDDSGAVAEGTPSKSNSLLVKYFSEGKRGSLMGLKKGDTLVLRLGEAFGDKEREWLISDLGLDGNDPESLSKPFLMTVDKIGHVENRELDEAFFKEAYPALGIETEEAFREQIRSEIRSYYDRQARNHLQHELWHHLNEKTRMEFPDDFLRRWLMEGQEKPKSAEEVEAEYPTFRNQLRWTLISDRIVRDNDIKVAREDVTAKMREQVLGYFGGIGMEGHMDWVEGYVERMMKDEDQVEASYRRVLNEKVLQWAESRSTPREQPIGVEEFGKILEQHRHEH